MAKSFSVENLRVDNIAVPGRLRQLDEAKVASIQKSIEEIELNTPITVRPEDRFERATPA